LTRAADLDAVRREGKRIRTPHLEVRYIASLSLLPRIGIIVPRHKQSAVARNKVKRRLRELSRATLMPVLAALPPLDVVLRAAPEAYGADHAMLAADVQRVMERLSGGRV
jgi:ribonuclease P protein component